MQRFGIGWSGGFDKILSTLWLSVVKPVLEILAFPICDSVESLPRIIWCPTGPLSFLPIHAAGLYDTTESGNKLSDFAISSYTTTLSALLDKPSTATPSPEFCGLLAVSQPNTPGLSTLPSTKQEIEQIKKHVDADKFVWLDGSAATKQTVLDQMVSINWLHLACHAVQHPEPPKSAFWLEDGGLEIGDIISTSHAHAEFAFLSACQTATGDDKLSEEAVHLAAALQLAGYRSVIATMWSIRDEDAPTVADEVYKHLMHGKVPDSTKAAAALHHATMRLQSETRPPGVLDDAWFLRWVPFIHIGV
ncbi:hypothetical protein DENSPDRAFT_173352 [Dentipellis sp. KUC8613]|nr:hypothetical protein DENSPDRAFT_173352 [Dentipellis sp. KUC8613]